MGGNHSWLTTLVVLSQLLMTTTACTGCVCFATFATCSDIKHVTTLRSNIETLVVRDITVESLPSYAFSHLKQLTELDIQSSYIGVVRKNAFSDIDKLDVLSISFSDISVVENGAFHGLRGMSSLEISDTRLDKIEMDSFSDITDISDITVKSCNISVIGKMAFHNISTVDVFQFYENKVDVIEADAFSNWRDIRTANVNSNRFERFECISDKSFAVAFSFNFYKNYLTCECHTAWILTSPYLKGRLLSNMCFAPRSQVDLSMSSVTRADLSCPFNPSPLQMGCPSDAIVTSPPVVNDTTTSRHSRMTSPTMSTTPCTSTTNSQTETSTEYESTSTSKTPTIETETPTVADFSHSSFIATTTSGENSGSDVPTSTDQSATSVSPSTSGQSSRGTNPQVHVPTLLAIVMLLCTIIV